MVIIIFRLIIIFIFIIILKTIRIQINLTEYFLN
jgi:hypothetical protein